MSAFNRISKVNLLAAIRDYPKNADDLAERYLAAGVEAETADIIVVERGKQYDARLLVLAAYARLIGEPATEAELPADLARFVTRLELTAISRSEALAAETLKAARNRVPGSARPAGASRAVAAAVPEVPAPAVCSSCFTQLPAGSKRCDFCD